MELDDVIRKHALLNAALHDGRADEKAVIKKLIVEVSGVKEILKDKEKRAELMERVRKIIEEVNKLSLDEQISLLEKEYGIDLKEIKEEKSKKTREGLPPLPGADKVKKVVTRFAPAPSGALHIGQVLRAAFISYMYARMYNGKFIVRIEDTDPKRIKKVYYDWILEDLRALGINWDEVVYESDHFEIYYKLTRKLFEEGKAYVCTCSPEEFKKYKEEKKPCPHRDKYDKVEYWEKMLSGEFREGEAVVRLKTDMAHKNPALRDPPLLRIIESVPHPRTGYKYRVYPLYNYACAIEDHLSGITHIIRGKEHETNEQIQLEIYKAFGWEPPIFIQYGMIKLPELKIHKRHIRENLRKGKLQGWDDLSLPTVRALLRRGIHPKAFAKMALHVGVTKSDITVSLETLYAFNRQVLSPIAKRISFVDEPYRVEIEGITSPIEVKMPWIPGNEEAGYRYYRLIPKEENGRKFLEVFVSESDMKLIEAVFGANEIIRLKEFANISIIDIDKEKKYIKAKFHSWETVPGVKKIHWVPGSELAISAKLLMPDGTEIKGYVEYLASELPAGEYVQLERKGFGRIDRNEGELIVIAFAHP